MTTVERMEGGFAVLEEEGKFRDVPLSELPAGIREGDRLQPNPEGGWRISPEETEAARARLAAKRRRLLGGKS